MVGGIDEACLITVCRGAAGGGAGRGTGLGAVGAAGGIGRAEGGVALAAAAFCFNNSSGLEVIKVCSSGEATTFRATWFEPAKIIPWPMPEANNKCFSPSDK